MGPNDKATQIIDSLKEVTDTGSFYNMRAAVALTSDIRSLPNLMSANMDKENMAIIAKVALNNATPDEALQKIDDFSPCERPELMK